MRRTSPFKFSRERLRAPIPVCLALAFCLFGCATGHAPHGPIPLTQDAGAPVSESEGSRVSPVYEQWLYRQSMLAQADKLARGVSGTSLLWRHSAAVQDKALLRSAAPTWIVLDFALLPMRPLPAVARALPRLSAHGISGIWLENVCEKDTAWRAEDEDEAGHGQAGLGLSSALGSEEDLVRFVQAMQASGIQSGMPLVPAATGLGPDFMLQARNSSRHQGLYAMLDVPRDLWPLLPDAAGPWDCQCLDADAVRALTEARVLPGSLRQDNFPGVCAFWAVTGQVLGVDGKARRLVYRASGSPRHPVLLWQDPAGAARLVFSGSVISVTGHRRQALAGIALDGLAGLDMGSLADGSDQSAPATQALSDLSQQIRRYGGWSLALNGHEQSQGSPAADFVSAPGFTRALAQALSEGRTDALVQVLRGLMDQGKELADMAFFAPGSSPDAVPSAADALLTQALPAGLPGLCFLDGSVLPEVRGQTLRTSVLGTLQPVLLARAALKLSEGRLVRVDSPSPGVLATTCSLPGGGFFVTALNFSDKPAGCRLSLPAGTTFSDIQCLTSGGSSSEPSSGPAFSLKPRQAAHYLAGRASGGTW